MLGGPEIVIVLLYVLVPVLFITWMVSVSSNLRRISNATERIAESLERSSARDAMLPR